jgi:HK97 family phage portal protein
MAEKRSLWDKLLAWVKKPPADIRPMAYVSLGFTGWAGDPYSSDLVRGAVDAIARNGAKLKPRHVRRVNGKVQPAAVSSIERLLQIRPNPRMNTYDFLYKVIATLMLQNNAYMYPEYDQAFNLVAIWPVTYTHSEFLEDADANLYVRFALADGKQAVLPYDDILHLRRHFMRSELMGDDNSPIKSTLEVITTTDEGMAKAVKTSANLRGLLSFTTMLKPEDLRKQRDDFVKEFLNVDKSGGIAALDAKASYTPLVSEPKIVNAPQMQELRNRVYRYFGINEKIVMSTYSEDDWNAFYESVLEPIATALSLEFTAKLFSDRERGHGNEIIFEANRLQYASVKTKLALQALVDRGAMTPNQWLDAFNLPAIEGGDVPIRRLDTRPVDEGKKTDDDGGDDDGGKS